MTTTDSIFHKTSAGYDACGLAGCRLPAPYLALLHAVQYATRFPALAALLPQSSEAEVLGYLEDLEAIGLIESLSAQWMVALYHLGTFEPKALRS
jgi:hypothetical protein